GAANVLRHGQDPVRRDKLPFPRRNALLRPILRRSQGDHRRPHLGGPALPDCRRTGEDPRQEGRPLHGEALLPTASMTLPTNIISEPIRKSKHANNNPTSTKKSQLHS